ncbi:MAG TPA: hypothetical protein VF970_11335 [Gemmatimonadales bacterium]
MTHPDQDHPLNALDREVTPPAVLEARVRRTLRARGLLARRAAGWRQMLAIAAAVTLMLAGYAVGKRASTGPAAAAGTRYVLFLYEDARFDTSRPEAELVAEYGTWARALRERGQLDLGEKLADQVMTVDPDSAATPATALGAPLAAGGVSGFFVIRAAGDQEALAIARTCPHLKYGGRVMVRPIVET